MNKRSHLEAKLDPLITMNKKSHLEAKLDPLFDYSNMQPPIFIEDDDDDDDDDVQIMHSTNPIHQLKATDIEVNAGSWVTKPPVQERPLVVPAIDDNDWMEPPPSKTGCHKVLPAHSMLVQVKTNKEELRKIMGSTAAECVKAARKAAAKEVKDRGQRDEIASPLPGRCVPQTPSCGEAPNNRPKILLKLQSGNGESHRIKFGLDEKFEKLFAHYADKLVKRPISEFIFRFDGVKIDPKKTPKDLEMEDEDIVEVSPPANRRR